MKHRGKEAKSQIPWQASGMSLLPLPSLYEHPCPVLPLKPWPPSFLPGTFLLRRKENKPEPPLSSVPVFQEELSLQFMKCRAETSFTLLSFSYHPSLQTALLSQVALLTCVPSLSHVISAISIVFVLADELQVAEGLNDIFLKCFCCIVSRMEELVGSQSYSPHAASLMVTWIALKARMQSLGMVMLCFLMQVPWLVKK